MKKVLLLILSLLVIAGMASAQQASIGLFADPLGTNCNIYDTAPGIINVYVLHLWTSGSSGSRFGVAQFNGANLTYLSESLPMLAPPFYLTASGSSQLGIHIYYQATGMLFGCLTAPIHILTIEYWGSGLSSTCSYLKVVSAPGMPYPMEWNCWPAPMPQSVTGGTAVINPDATCICDVPVEHTSWGRIKELYR